MSSAKVTVFFTILIILTLTSGNKVIANIATIYLLNHVYGEGSEIIKEVEMLNEYVDVNISSNAINYINASNEVTRRDINKRIINLKVLRYRNDLLIRELNSLRTFCLLMISLIMNKYNFGDEGFEYLNGKMEDKLKKLKEISTSESCIISRMKSNISVQRLDEGSKNSLEVLVRDKKVNPFFEQ